MALAKDRYIVTFKSDQGFKAMESYFNTEASQSQAQLQKSLKNIQTVILKTSNVSLIESLKNHPEVAVVEKEFFTPSPKPVNGFKIARVVQTEMMRPMNSGQADAITPIFKAGDSTPWGILAVHAGEAWADSAAGANSRVVVLDTGIDATHPVIAQNFEKGQNFTEDSSGQIDPKKYADEEGHGTHCSGTILGVFNEQTGFTGVAPKAKLLMGRVCGTEGCSNVAVVDGINWAVAEKADVVSMSLGGPVSSQAELKAVQAAERAGVVIVAASGNGASDPNYSYDKKDPKCRPTNPFKPTECGVSFPGAFPTVVAVGAVDSTLVKTNFSQWGPELDITAPGAAVISSVPQGTGRESIVRLSLSGVQKSVKSAAFSGTELFATPLTQEIVVVPGMGKPEDFAQVQVAGKFALVSRGEIKFSDKVQNALAAKAAGVLIYNNTTGLMQGALTTDGSLIKLPVVMIEQTAGQELIQALSQGGKVTADITLAPSNYASFDGTSMATPHVAGVVALIRSANKKLTPEQVRQILKSTAQALSPNDTNQYGAGFVQADKAVQAALSQ
jgi:subtilisin family serine protease